MSMVPKFLSGLRFCEGFAKPSRAARTLVWISSELMMRARSELYIMERGSEKVFFTSEAAV